MKSFLPIIFLVFVTNVYSAGNCDGQFVAFSYRSVGQHKAKQTLNIQGCNVYPNVPTNSITATETACCWYGQKWRFDAIEKGDRIELTLNGAKYLINSQNSFVRVMPQAFMSAQVKQDRINASGVGVSILRGTGFSFNI